MTKQKHIELVKLLKEFKRGNRLPIEALEDGKISIFGDANSDVVTTWKEAIELGLKYEENGW